LKELYIHIGLHKTATSLIQYLLSTNRALFEKESIYYPDINGSHEHHSLLLKWFEVHKAYCGSEIDPQHEWGKIINFCKEGEGKVIISSEEFSRKGNHHVNIHELGESLSELNVKIVFYIRRQDEFIESCYNQMAKTAHVGSFNNFYAAGHLSPILHHINLDYHSLYSSWAEVFGADNIICRTYDRERIKGDILKDFLNALELSLPSELDSKVLSANTSLDPRTVLTIQELELNKIQPNQRALEIISNYWKQYPISDGRVLSLMSYEDRHQLLLNYTESNNALAYISNKGRALFPVIAPEDHYNYLPGIPKHHLEKINLSLKN